MTDNLPALASNTSVFLPTGELDENRAIDIIAGLMKKLQGMEKKDGREWLKTELLEGLRDGLLPVTNYAITLAEAGDEICAAALSTVFVEIGAAGGVKEYSWEWRKTSEQRPAHYQVWAYGLRVHQRPPPERPRGRRWHDNLVRNFYICHLIGYACREFGVRPTRNRESRRAKRAPSGISLVVAAAARNNIDLQERSVQQDIWFSLPGELVRRGLQKTGP
jgi:hypothetical protein